MAIAQHLDFHAVEKKIHLLPWQVQGLQYTHSGYGRKIPTIHMVKVPGGKRWRRLYCCIFSNSGTCYVTTKKGDWITFS